MRKAALFATFLVLGLSLAGVGVVLGHSGSGEEGLLVEPSSITAGGTVVLAGSGLEPDSDRVLVLAGGNLTVGLGTVKTDAEGMFSQEITIPTYLPSGDYELQAIGDETLTTPLAVTAVAGGAVGTPEDGAGETIVARDRGPAGMAIIFGFAGILALLGALLVWKAERFRGLTQG